MRNIQYFILLLSFIIFFACKSTENIPPVDYLTSLKADVTYLADDALEGRKVGTPGELKAAEYIAKRFKSIGVKPKGTDEFFQIFTASRMANPHSTAPSDSDEKVEGRNVVGFIDHGARNTIVIGAHYDHLGYGGIGSLHTGGKAIHNGADDNASGVSAMLLLAEKLKTGPTNNNYLFIAFSGEEEGLWGSNHYSKNMTIPVESVNYMINMDMVGRLNSDRQLAIYGVGTSSQWKSNIEAITNPTFKFTYNESGIGPSDHTSFYLQDIPVLHFFTGQHRDYHKPSDDVEFINFQGLLDVSDFIYELILRYDDDGKIDFIKTKEEESDTPRFKVTLGVMPDYLFDGEGMRIDGVIEGRVAQKADMQAGDIVIQMGDLKIIDMMSYMKALSAFEKGESTIVIIKRGDKVIEKKVVF